MTTSQLILCVTVWLTGFPVSNDVTRRGVPVIVDATVSAGIGRGGGRGVGRG